MFDIEITNFQSIAHARLTLEGFTTIVGPSNRGKSAVLRALRAVLYNELHPSMIREGAKECTLRIHFPPSAPHDVKTIEFIKSSTKNVYTITMRDGTVKPYPKAGNETPPEVQALGFTRVTTEREETFNLNFQRQLETLFLVCDTPTTFTSFMQKVFRLEKYERALRNINADLLKIGREHDQVGLDIQSKTRDLEATTTNLEAKRATHDTLNTALKTLDKSEARLADLEAARAKLVEAEQGRTLIAQARATAAAHRTLADRLISYLALLKRDTALTSKREVMRTQQRQHADLATQLAVRKPLIAALSALATQLSRATSATGARATVVAQHTTLANLKPRHSGHVAAGAIFTTYHNALTGIVAQTQRLVRLGQAKEAIVQIADKLEKGRGSLARRRLLLPAFDTLLPLAARLTRLGQAKEAIDAALTNRDSISQAQIQARNGKQQVEQYAEWIKTTIGHCPTCGGDMCQRHAA